MKLIWENGGRKHGLWGNLVRYAFVGLSPPGFRPVVYDWSIDGHDGPGNEGEEASLPAAKKAVAVALRRLAADQNSHWKALDPKARYAVTPWRTMGHPAFVMLLHAEPEALFSMVASGALADSYREEALSVALVFPDKARLAVALAPLRGDKNPRIQRMLAQALGEAWGNCPPGPASAIP